MGPKHEWTFGSYQNGKISRCAWGEMASIIVQREKQEKFGTLHHAKGTKQSTNGYAHENEE